MRNRAVGGSCGWFIQEVRRCLSSRLPFTHSEFLGVFERYNQDAWPFAALLWLCTLVILVRWARSRYTDNRPLFLLLAVLWAWSALVYFVGFFRAINPAAWLFAGLFLIQSLLFIRLVAHPRGMDFVGGHSFRRGLATLLMVYALSYPFVGLALGMVYPQAADIRCSLSDHGPHGRRSAARRAPRASTLDDHSADVVRGRWFGGPSPRDDR